MKLDYSDISAMIEYIKDKALQEGKSLEQTQELIEYLDENVDGFINVLKK